MVVAPTEKPKAPMPAAESKDVTAQALAEAIRSAKTKEFFEWTGDVVVALVNALIAHMFGILGGLAARLAKLIMQAKDLGDPAYNELAEVAIKDLLDMDVKIGHVSAARAGGQHGQVVKTIGEGLLRGMFGDYLGGRPEAVQPSSTAAERWIQMMVRLGYEGWLTGWLIELFGAGQLEQFGTLDVKLTETLGLGRLSRRVLAPPMGILVEQPFTWLLNRTYRPSLLGSGELIRQHLRGRATRERVFRELSWAGYKDEDIEGLLATHQRLLSDTDVRLLLDRKVWTEEQGIQHLRDAGYSEALAKTTLQLEEERRVDAYRRKTVDAAVDAFVRRDIEEPQLREMLRTIFLPEWEDFWIRKVAGARRVMNLRHLTTSEVEQAVKRGILTLTDFRAHCQRLGYSPADVRTLELLLMTEIADKAAADKAKAELAAARATEKALKALEQAARRAEIEAEQAVRGVSLAQFEAMVRRGLRSIEQYREFLRALKYAPEDISALAELLEGQIDDARAAAERRAELEAEARKRKLSLGDLERAVKLGVMSVDEYRSQLAAAGFGDEDRALLAGILQRELDVAAENEARKAAAQAALAVRKVSLEDLERAVRLGRRTVDQYRARLVQEGFAGDEADLLADLLRAAVAADQEARERRAEIEARLRKKKISLWEMEQAVRAGVRPMADYRALLVREGYSDADAELLERLLKLQIDRDTEAAEKRAEAEARLAAREISLSDVERAVKLGVLDVAAYKRVLTREGFSTEDQAVLLDTLRAELAVAREAQRKRAAAEKEAAARRISLSDLERAVRGGVRSVVEYQGVLRDLGYPAQDQATLMGLLQLQMAQDQAARLKRQEAETALALRGLSLAQWERAVVQGVRTMAAYRAWLAEQGYGIEDAATLVALLQLEIAAGAPA